MSDKRVNLIRLGETYVFEFIEPVIEQLSELQWKREKGNY